MAAASHNRSEALTLIRALNECLESDKTILASQDDCNYFRSIYRTLKEVKEPAPQPQPIPIAAPVKEIPAPQPAPVTPPLPSIAKVPEPPPLPEPPAIELPKRQPLPGFDDIRKILSQAFPDLSLLPDIPNDALARQRAERWKTQNQAAMISILTFHESEWQHQFLVNLTAAIDVIYGHARLIAADAIEKENKWETFLSAPELKVVIICDYALWQMPHLLQFYRENPNRMDRMLQKTPVMLLPDLTLYQKDPLLKRSLWKALCQKIGSPQP